MLSTKTFSETDNNTILTMGDTEVQAAEAAGENIPEIELIIKASTVDGRRKGACLFCQVC